MKLTISPSRAVDQAKRLIKRSDFAREGFTLLETVVALAVLVAGVVGPVSLVTRGIYDFSFSKNKITAANLAEEGIELIRVIRENNMICDVLNGPTVWPWNEDPSPPDPPNGNTFSNITAGVSVDRSVATTCGGVGGVTIISPILSLGCSGKLRLDPATGAYGYTSGQETIFSRCVQALVPPGIPDSDAPPEDQMDIISTVTWSERGVNREVKLRERLYHWR